jgi:hypothetical protein
MTPVSMGSSFQKEFDRPLLQVIRFHDGVTDSVIRVADDSRVASRWDICDDRGFEIVRGLETGGPDRGLLAAAPWTRLPIIIRVDQPTVAIAHFERGISQRRRDPELAQGRANRPYHHLWTLVPDNEPGDHGAVPRLNKTPGADVPKARLRLAQIVTFDNGDSGAVVRAAQDRV